MRIILMIVTAVVMFSVEARAENSMITEVMSRKDIQQFMEKLTFVKDDRGLCYAIARVVASSPYSDLHIWVPVMTWVPCEKISPELFKK